MAKIKAPLFSLDASGTLDKTLTYRKKPQNNTASKYSKPGSVNPFESSPRQKDQRSIIGLITACWQSKTSLDKLSWDASAKAARFKGSGYHYFLHLAQSDLTTYLGLVGFWSMNYNVGDKIPDLSGNANHGTLGPIYPCDCPQPVDSISKKQGKALSYDGIDDYIDCGNGATLNFTNYFTLLALVNVSEFQPIAPNINSICGKSFDGDYSGFRIRVRNYKFGALFGSGTTYINVYGLSPLIINTWYHVSLVFDGSDSFIYLNGEIDSLVVPVPLVLSAQPFFIGKYHGGRFFNGIIDNVILYNRVLSPQEIKRHYSLLI